MMILGLLPLAVGRLVKISRTTRDSIDGNVFMGLDVLDVLVVESLRTFGLLLRRRCGVVSPHRVRTTTDLDLLWPREGARYSGS